MTGLHRTHLTTSQKVEFSAKAIAGQAEHGTITNLSQQFNISRPTVYGIQESVQKILEDHFEKPEADHNTICVEVSKNQLHRAIIALRVIAPNSIRSIEDLLPILYPGLKVSYGIIQKILSDAENEARDFNERVDLSAIKHSALDEMFSQGDPVLAGIDLSSGYLHSLELRESRSADDWSEVLDKGKLQGLDLEVVVKDAAKGIAAGVTRSFPQAEQRDDCFHVLYDTNKLRQKLRSKAYAAIEEEYQKQKQLEKQLEDEQKKQLQKELLLASEAAQRRIARYDCFENAVHLITEAMEYVDLETGTLYTGHEAEQMMIDAANLLNAIEHPECKKLATYIHNRASGIALAAHALNKELNALMPGYTITELSHACLITRLSKQLKKNSPVTLYNKQYQFFLGLYAQLEHQLGTEKTDALFKTINRLLENRSRASSAIEGFNASLRPYLYVQKGVTQNFLELYKAYYNLRTRRWGRHKGTSSHECITGNAVADWLSFLGYPVSTQSERVSVH